MTKGADLTVHQVGQLNSARDRFDDVFWSRLLTFGIRLMHGVDEHGFDFGTRELLAGAGEDDGVEVGRPAAVLCRLRASRWKAIGFS